MKAARKVFFRLFVLVAILICSGSISYANHTVNPYIVEFAEGENTNTTIISDIDSFNNDQIPQMNFTCSFSVSQDPDPIEKDSFSLPDSFFSIWQPPQL